MGRLGPSSHPHIPRIVCLATPSQTNTQCSPPFLDLKFLMFPLLVWPLRIKGLALFLISHVSVYNPARHLEKPPVWTCGVYSAQFQWHRSYYDVNGALWKQAVWLLALSRRKQCLTQLRIPGKRTAMLIKAHRLTASSPASKYSAHGVWQAQGHNTQWSRKKSIL